MTGNVKRRMLILLGLVMIFTAMIAAGLPQLDLQPGMPLLQVEKGSSVNKPSEEGPGASMVSKTSIELFILLYAGLILYLILRLNRDVGKRNLGHFILLIVSIITMVGSIVYLMLILLSGIPSSHAVELPMPNATAPVTSPLGPVPPLLLWLVGIGLLVISSLLGVWIFGSSSNRAIPIDLVGIEAEKAWQALKDGLALKDVIVKCYRQMSLAVEKKQGIKREESMTTREFERLLESAGIPHDPVHQLTQLFEAVRYGNWQPNPKDEQKAIHCLEAIMLYSREAKETG